MGSLGDLDHMVMNLLPHTPLLTLVEVSHAYLKVYLYFWIFLLIGVLPAVKRRIRLKTTYSIPTERQGEIAMESLYNCFP